MNMDEVDWEERYRRLIEEAPYIPGDDINQNENCAGIDWSNPDLIRKGQEFTKKHKIGLTHSHSSALVLGFSLKNLSTVLIRTGGFNTMLDSIDRILDTGNHILQWYESDLISQIGDGYKTVQVVRKLHRLALKKCSTGEVYEPDPSILPNERLDEKIQYLNALKADLECVDTSDSPIHLLTYNPKVLLNQLDMALTQFGFFAPIWMYPHVFGINDPEGLKGFVHLWAIIGRLLGVHDRYNLALNPNPQLIIKIHDTICMASLKDASLITAGLQFSYVEALSKFYGFKVTLPALTYFGFSSKTGIPQFEGEHLYSIMTFRDKIFVLYLKLLFFLMYHFDFIRSYFHKEMDKKSTRVRGKLMEGRKKRLAAASNNNYSHNKGMSSSNNINNEIKSKLSSRKA